MELFTTQWTKSDGWSAPLPAWDGVQTLVMVYGGSELLDDPGPLRDVLRTFPTARVVGCSSAGEIMEDTISDDSLTVAIARFAQTTLSQAHEQVLSPDQSFAAGLSLAKRLTSAEPDMRALFVVSDGLGVNGSTLIAGLLEGTEGKVTISGGLAGDGDRFGRTWVLADGAPRRGYVSAVGLGGPYVTVGHGTRGGWDIFGPERRITRSVGNVLFELDGLPALDLYKKYLGERAAGLPATALLFPLAVRTPGAMNRQLVRTILAVDERDQSMTFAGDVPEGSMAQLMRANFDRLIDGAHAAAQETGVDTTVPGPTLAVAVSCVGRRLILGRRTEDELEATLSGLPESTRLVGFYSYGEISPIAAGTCDLHNESMTITTFQERP